MSSQLFWPPIGMGCMLAWFVCMYVLCACFFFLFLFFLTSLLPEISETGLLYYYRETYWIQTMCTFFYFYFQLFLLPAFEVILWTCRDKQRQKWWKAALLMQKVCSFSFPIHVNLTGCAADIYVEVQFRRWSIWRGSVFTSKACSYHKSVLFAAIRTFAENCNYKKSKIIYI